MYFFLVNGDRGPDCILLRVSIDPVKSLGREAGFGLIELSSEVRGTGAISRPIVLLSALLCQGVGMTFGWELLTSYD